MYLISGNLKIMRWVRTASGISSFVSCALEKEACPTSSVICFSCAVCVYSLPVRQRCLFVLVELFHVITSSLTSLTMRFAAQQFCGDHAKFV